MKNHLATLLNFFFRGLVTSQHGEMIPKIVDDNFSFSRGRKGEHRDLSIATISLRERDVEVL